MKKNITSRIVFGSAFVAILIFSGIVFLNTADKSFGQSGGECFPESGQGVGDGFCLGIDWTPASDVWHSNRSAINFRADPNITPPPTADEVRDYGLFPTSCTTGLNYGDTCGPVCYTYKRGAQICRQSPINRFDNLPPVCGSWTRSGNTFTLSGSTDAPASGDSGSSGILVAGGTCTATAGGTCNIIIKDEARNETSCTSPVNPTPTHSCSGPAPTNAGLCPGDDSGLGAPATNRLVPACTVADKCEFTCNSGYEYQNILGIPACVPIPSQPPLSCSPRSQSTGVGAGVRYEATGGDGNYNWSVLEGENCFGEVEALNPKVFWPGCNTPGPYWVNVSDNSGSSDSCRMNVVEDLNCTVSPASATIMRGGSVGFNVVSNIVSAPGNQVFFSISGFVNGLASNVYIGAIPVGNNSFNFEVTAESQAALGNSNFTVSCSLDCAVGGCPSGGSPFDVDENPVGITVIGGTPPGSCNYNGIQDNGETGVDCGGGNCPSCTPPPGSCNYNGIQDNGETGVDCGGGNCPVCVPAVGSVIVSSNDSSATWLLVGPQDSYVGSGTYRNYSSLPAPGTYNVISTNAECEVDVPASQVLWPSGVVNFNLTCGDLPPQPTCFISAIPSSQSANIGSNASFTAVTTCSDGSTPPENIDLTAWSVNKSATFVSGQSNSRTTTLRCDSSTGGVPAVVTPTLGSLVSISSNLSCNPVLTCSPVNQTVDTNQNVSFSASGGSTYSWTATGGTPASGSSASFSTRYVTAGNKTVSVESGENTASCSVNVIQPRHNECVMVNGAPACTLVDGRAPDRCNTAADCGVGSCNYNGIQDNGETGVDCGGGGCPACAGTPPLKYSCASGSCQVDSSGPYTDSTCGGVCTATYYSCSSGSCVPDSSGQFTSANCNNMCVAPIYGRCSAASRACVNTTDPSGTPCSGDVACGSTGETHLGCIGNACVIMSGPGSDVCGAVGEACATGGTGSCSLKAAPPLVSGGQSVKLTWQCVGAPTCSLTRKYNNSNTTITLQDPAIRTTGTYSDKPVSSGIYTLDCDVSTADATASVKVSTLIECAPTDSGCRP